MDWFMEGRADKRAIDTVSELYAAYLKGWDSAIHRAAFDLDGAARDAVLALLKTTEETQ